MLVVRSLEGESLEDYSHRVATAWALGKKGKDNGVLLFIAVDDRKLRIEVGYGLEGLLPDSRCGRIIRDAIAPRFRSKDYDAGVRAGVDSILDALAGKAERRPARPGDSGELLSATDRLGFYALVVMTLVVLSLFGPALEGPAVARGVCLVSTVGWAGVLSYFHVPGALWALVAHPLFFYLWRWLGRTRLGKALVRGLSSSRGGRVYGGGWSSGSSWSSGGGSWGGGGFSGGGGSFGGGGASGSW